jgi:hypothetical protein
MINWTPSNKSPVIKTWRFASKSNPKHTHETRLYQDDSTSCNCSGWTRPLVWPHGHPLHTINFNCVKSWEPVKKEDYPLYLGYEYKPEMWMAKLFKKER